MRIRTLWLVVMAASACTSPTPSTSRAYAVTTVPLAQPLPRAAEAPLDPRDAEIALFFALNRARAGQAAPPLRIDRGLALVAQSTAGEYRRLGRGSEARLLAAADRDLQAFALTFERTTSAIVFAERIAEGVAALAVALDPAAHWVGLSVVEAPPPVGPRGGYGVVLTLAQ